MFGFVPEQELYWVNEVRLWSMALAAVAAIVTLGAGYAQIRLQTIVAEEKATLAAALQRSSDERISATQAEAAKANERTAELEKQTIEARRELEKERAERLRLESRFGPRSLKAEQVAQIVRDLSPHKMPIAVSASSEEETRRYATEIVRALQAAGARVRLDEFRAIAPVWYGLILRPPETGANPLPDALTRAGIEFTNATATGLGPPRQSPEETWLYVGAKPLR
jgi:hypothetical protein